MFTCNAVIKMASSPDFRSRWIQLVIFTHLHRAAICGISAFFALCIAVPSAALAAEPLSQVRALIYSKTAAEIQWSRSASELVQVSYNDRVVGIMDANSYFRGSLDASISHRFEMRTVSSDNTLSAPSVITFSTQDFDGSVRQVNAAATTSDTPSQSDTPTPSENTTPSGDAQAILSGVSAKIYSQSAAELFWNRSSPVLVDVTYNGQSLGRFDASSFYKGDLSNNTNHRFDVSALDGSGNKVESYTLAFSTAAFSGTVETVAGVETGQQSAPVVAPQPVPQPEPVAAPTPEPQPEPTPTPVNDDPPVSGSGIQPVRSGDCVVNSISDLSGCVNAAQGLQRINIRSDLSCSNNSCCPTGGALLRLDNTRSLTIEGNGFRMLREGGQRQCSLLDVTNSSSLTIRNWNLDDDVRVAGCLVTDRCPRMLHIRNSRDVLLEQVNVSNGKGYTIYVQEVNGFGFIDSRLENSGVLGLYVGHSGRASTNVRIQNSVFLDNQTNALALLGVVGSSVSTNIVSDNVFKRNHFRGQFPVAPRFGTGFTGGGQVYIAEATGVTVRGNTISDGFCENCFIQQTLGTGVSGIEISVPNSSSVRNVLITDNTVENHDAWGIFVNEGSTVDSSVVISNNRLLRNTVGLKPAAARVSGNTIQNR